MDVYEMSPSEQVFRIDDLLDLSNDDLFSSTSSSDDSLKSSAIHHDPLPHLPPISSSSSSSSPAAIFPSTHLLTEDFSFPPSDDVAELEWLSQFVEDSSSDIPIDSLAGSFVVRPDKPQTKRSRPVSSATDGILKHGSTATARGDAEGVVLRCTHCASEKTPQWRTGPLGPKTLCNACGVRYKSGRLVPEYRPAASPTFVLNQHSNSHRKVMELRRQKELPRQEQLYCNQRQHDFQLC